ncbi:MAG: hypothetical protein WBD10_06125, partial [Acidobacteriaceae bacterium]
MATSEYIPDKRTSTGEIPPLRAVPPRTPRGFFRASMLASLPMVLNDILAILLALGAALLLRAVFLDRVIRFRNMWQSIGGPSAGMLYLTWFVLVYVLVARRYGLYGHVLKTSSGAHELRMTAQACVTAGLLLCGVLYMAHNLAVSRALVILLILSAMGSLCIRRAVWRKSRYRQYERGVSTRHVVILGTDHLSRGLARHISSEAHLGYTMRGHISCPGRESSSELAGLQVLGGLEDLATITRKHFIDEVIIAERCPLETVLEIIKEAHELGIDVRCLCGYYNDLAPYSGIEYIGT